MLRYGLGSLASTPGPARRSSLQLQEKFFQNRVRRPCAIQVLFREAIYFIDVDLDRYDSPDEAHWIPFGIGVETSARCMMH